MPKAKGKVADTPYSPYPHLSMSSASAPGYASASSNKSASGSSRILDIIDSKYTHNWSESASREKIEKTVKKRAAPEKQQRKKKADKQPVEKRGAIFKKACPKTILERVDRVSAQRFYLIDRTRNGKELREQFSVLGSTGNVYTVVIDRTPKCDCPDASKGNHCKHILFVYMKVLQVPYTSTHWYQKALLTTELQEIFDNAPPAPNTFAHGQVLEAYACATGKTPSSNSQPSGSSSTRRVPGEGDDCPICYEGMAGDAQTPNKLTYCESCGNALHTECFKQWQRQTPNNVTCVWCRAKWAVSSAGSSTRYSEGYVNLSSVAGVSPVRDTSSYYHGPRRGQRYYGYQEYDEDPFL